MLHSHLAIASFGILFLCLVLSSSIYARNHTSRLADLHAPTSAASARALSGLQRSLAALRGWMALGHEEFRRERRFAWEQQVEPALAELEKLSKDWTDPEDVEILQESREALADLREVQWWIEDMAHTPGNEPARARLTFDVEPVATQITEVANRLVEDENLALEKRFALARFQTSLAESRAALGVWVDSGREEHRVRHQNRLTTASDHLGQVLRRQSTLSSLQVERLDLIARELEAYGFLADGVIAARQLPDANRAHHLLESTANPLAQRATRMLSQLSDNQEAITHKKADHIVRLMAVQIGLGLGLVCLMCVAAFLLSARRARSLAEPITRLSDAARSFREKRIAPDMDTDRSDEIGELARSFVALQKEVLSFEEELKERNRELALSNRDLESFAGAASHDLQEPLRMVACYTKILQKRYHGKLDKNADEFLEFACDGALRMQSMIQGLLELFRIGKTNLDTGIVDAGEVVDLALNNLQAVVLERQPVIEKGELPTVKGNKAQLALLFQNLLSNALKYCDRDTPKVKIEATQTDPNTWQFSVRDNGIGFTMDQAKRIFDVFERLHTVEESYKGSGIGLSLCQKIVEHHGGEIWAESEPGEGATFYFTLQAPDE